MSRIEILGEGDAARLHDLPSDVFDFPVRDGWAREFLADPRHHLAVASVGGLIVGFASAVHYVHPDKEPELWVNEVGVSEEHRRLGLGRRLVHALIERARELGCAEAWVLTERENHAACRLYESAGGTVGASDVVMYSFPLGSWS